MKLTIDTDAQTLTRDDAGETQTLGLYTKRAFELISRQWVRIGWSLKYSYAFTWLGRPIIQMPEDVLRIAELIYRVRPSVVIETGVAHGGSLVLYASMVKLTGGARVIGVDVDIRGHNRSAIESHELAGLIHLIEGDSAAPATVQRVRSLIEPGGSVLVVLDSCHTKSHVAAELEAYHGLVTPGSYIVATDGVMRDLHDVPGGESAWRDDHPAAAAAEFARTHPRFRLEQPPRAFNESELTADVTYWPNAYLRRLPD